MIKDNCPLIDNSKATSFISKGEEDCLKVIYSLSLSNYEVRSVDIAKIMNVTKPGVYKTLQKLLNKEYIKKEKYTKINLTLKGINHAKKLHERYITLQTLLTDILQISKDIAEVDACEIEHCIGIETEKRIYEFVKKHISK